MGTDLSWLLPPDILHADSLVCFRSLPFEYKADFLRPEILSAESTAELSLPKAGLAQNMFIE